MTRPWPLLLTALLCCSGAGEAEQETLSLAARWLQGYVRLDTVNPPGNEQRAVAYLERLLHARGVASRRLVSANGRVNLYARLRARPDRDSQALVLLHHMDVVAPGPGWSRPPFGAELAEGSLWGRGTVDAKSLGVAHLAALLAAAELPARRRDVIFLAVADEERGGGEGTAWLLQHHPELFAGVAGVLNEGGSNRQVNGRLLWWGVEVAQKRPLWLEVVARGRGGHGAGFTPESAPHELVSALAGLLARPLRWRVPPAAREYLQALAPLHNDRWRPLLADPDRLVGPEGPRRGLLPGMANLFLDTVQINMLQGAAQINVIPPIATARVDARLLPETDERAFLAEIEQALGDEVEVRVLLSAPPLPPSPQTGPVYQLLARELQAVAPVAPYFSSGFTDSRYFRARGIPAYGFSPFTLEPQDLMGIHGADEHIPVAELDRGVERTRRLVLAWTRAER